MDIDPTVAAEQGAANLETTSPERRVVTFAAPREEHFASVSVKESGVMPETLDAKQRTVDVVWYSGASVPRVDPETGESYMLRLDMEGCRMDRLNNGAAVFDSHFNGQDFKSLMANKVGTKAQIGVVLKAWQVGPAGQATLKFDSSEEGEQTFQKIQNGTVRNLSHGTWINSMELESDVDGKKSYVATDWEPFEISAVTVPADFNTTFLTAQPNGAARATSPVKDNPLDNPQAVTEEQLSAARNEAITAERKRVTEITLAAEPMKKYGVTETFITGLVNEGLTLEASRAKIFAELAAKSDTFKPNANISITRDGNETRFSQMQSALLLRYDPNFGLSRKQRQDGSSSAEFIAGYGPEYQQKLSDTGREYRGFTLLEMAREALELSGVNTRGMNKSQLAEMALQSARVRNTQFFDGGSESTSDFPSILANVANKTARQAYEAFPQTFKPFSRMVTATDFKPLNRVQLSDAPALQKLNEAGEFRRANLSDTNQTYKLGTFGRIVSLTRQTIINDDLQMFTRVPAIMGVAAARMESDVTWGVITGNQVMGEDGNALFHTAHNNLFTGAGSALALAGITAGRSKLRLQTGQQGTPLNLTPRFAAVPTALETALLQLIYPTQLAATAVTGVVPEWVMSLVPIVEPRLDAASTTAWYLVSDNAVIDTVEYCYLEGQQGVYIETRQGFEVDGIEIKVREDFAAAAIDFRGLQKNAGV